MFIFLPAIPWNFYTQRPQHLCKALAKRGETVLYLCPTIDRSLFAASSEDSKAYRLRPLLPDIYELLILVDEAIDIHQVILPERSALQISEALQDFSCFQPVLFFQHPAWVSLLNNPLDLAQFQIVYDCMDDIESFPDAPKAALRGAEIELMKKSDKIFVTARKL